MFFLETIISIFFTAIGYLWIPSVFIIIGKKFSKKVLFIITMVNIIAMFTIFKFLYYIMYDSYSTNTTPALLWGSIGYYLMKRRILKKDSIEDFNESQTDSQKSQNISPYADDYRYYHKKFSFSLFIALFSCIISGGCVLYIGYQSKHIQQLSEKVSALESSSQSSEYMIKKTQETLSNIKDGLVLLDPYAKKYHKYSADHVISKSSYLGSKQDASSLGYDACFDCYLWDD